MHKEMHLHVCITTCGVIHRDIVVWQTGKVVQSSAIKRKDLALDAVCEGCGAVENRAEYVDF